MIDLRSRPFQIFHLVQKLVSCQVAAEHRLQMICIEEIRATRQTVTIQFNVAIQKVTLNT